MTVMRSNPKPRQPRRIAVEAALDELATACQECGLTDAYRELRQVIETRSNTTVVFGNARVSQAHLIWLLADRASVLFAELMMAFEAVMYTSHKLGSQRFVEVSQFALTAIGDLNIAHDLASKYARQPEGAA